MKVQNPLVIFSFYLCGSNPGGRRSLGGDWGGRVRPSLRGGPTKDPGVTPGPGDSGGGVGEAHNWVARATRVSNE